MRTLLRKYLEQDLSRRDFTKAMLAMGFSTSAISAVLSSEAVAESQALSEAFEVEGTGGMILV